MKNWQNAFDLKIVAFELAVESSPYYDENTCHLQSICYKILLSFQIQLRETFSKSICLIIMTQYDESAVVQI